MEYNIEISNFEGPLDLLLHLIKKSEMNIEEISIEEITKQYLDYIHLMENLNLNITSEYLVMAAELLEIKSQSLLPKKKDTIAEDENEDDLKQNLIIKLKEYEKYKQITEILKEYESSREKLYTKSPSNIDEYKKDNDKIDDEFDVNDLMMAINKMLERKKIAQPLNTKVTNKEYSLKERCSEIKNILKVKEEIEFIDLFDKYNKDYIVITFLSILTLSKEKQLIIKQENNFNNIIIKRG